MCSWHHMDQKTESGHQLNWVDRRFTDFTTGCYGFGYGRNIQQTGAIGLKISSTWFWWLSGRTLRADWHVVRHTAIATRDISKSLVVVRCTTSPVQQDQSRTTIDDFFSGKILKSHAIGITHYQLLPECMIAFWHLSFKVISKLLHLCIDLITL